MSKDYNEESEQKAKIDLVSIVRSIRSGMNANGDEVTRVLLRALPNQTDVLEAITEVDGPNGALMASYNAGGVNVDGNSDSDQDSDNDQEYDEEKKGEEEDQSLSGKLEKLLNNAIAILTQYLAKCTELTPPDLNLINGMIQLIADENEHDLNHSNKDIDAERFSQDFRNIETFFKDLGDPGIDHDNVMAMSQGMIYFDDFTEILKSAKKDTIGVTLANGPIEERNNRVVLDGISKDQLQEIMKAMGRNMVEESDAPVLNLKPKGSNERG